MSRSRSQPSLLPAAVLALLIVLAGCGGIPGPSAGPAPAAPTATSPPGTDPGNGGPSNGSPTARADPPTAVTVDAPTVNVTGATLPVDPGHVFAITRRILGTNGTSAPDVVVQSPEEMPFVAAPPTEFSRLLGLTLDRRNTTTSAYVRGPETVYVNERILDRPTLLETTLAHEYAHVVQHRTGAYDDLRVAGTSSDGRAVRRAILEGAAVYAADTYWQRHVRRGGRPARGIGRLYRNTTGATWYAVAQYRFGYRYVRAYTDAPEDLPGVYADPPLTSEAVIHRLPPGSEPPADLAVRVSGESREWFALPSRTRMGELFVRAVLRTERPSAAAARGADGWGADELITFAPENSTERGYVWVLRWDDAPNATEFRDGFRSYLEGRATRDGGDWHTEAASYRVEQLDSHTLTVYVGGDRFVANATATVDDSGSVTVRPPQASASGTATVTRSPTARTARPIPTSRAV